MMRWAEHMARMRHTKFMQGFYGKTRKGETTWKTYKWTVG